MAQTGLTKREIEILHLLAQGLSNNEIAAQIFLAGSTVKWYNSQIYSKLGVNNRQEAVEHATQFNLLQPKTVSISHNLPAYSTPFVGRKQELKELIELLAVEHIRLITILALGGMGKTRLVLELAAQLIHIQHADYPDGIFYVPLQPLSDSQQLVSQICNCIGYRFMGDNREPEAHLLEYLAQKRMLLVMDNWEQLSEGVHLLASMLSAAPGLRILVTSREKVRLSSETIYSLKEMDFPYQYKLEDAFEYDAVQLLVLNAQRVKPSWNVTPHNLQHVIDICRLTQGMPLAIVLAGSWLDTLSLEEVANEIQLSLDFLTTDMHDMPERQRSIRAVFDSMWNKLQPTEQQVFLKLSVFRGGFPRQAAQVIADANPRILQALVNRALITRDNQGRYDVHELLRQYAVERFENSDDSRPAHAAHSEYFLNWLMHKEADVKGRQQAKAIIEIDADFANVRTAWEWALVHDQYDWISAALECLTLFTSMRPRLLDGLELLSHAAQMTQNRPETQLCWASLVMHRMHLLIWVDPVRATKQVTIMEQALQIAKLHNDQAATAYGNLTLALIARIRQDCATAVGLFKKCITYFTSTNDIFVTAWALHWMGNCMRSLDGVDTSINYFRESLELRKVTGDHFGRFNTVIALGFDLMLAGNYLEAETLLQELAGTHDHADLLLGFINFLKGNYEDAKETSEKGILIAEDNKFIVTKLLALSLLGLVKCCEERYRSSVEYGEEVRTLMPFDEYVFLANWILSLAYCSLEDYEGARHSVDAALTYSYQIKANGAMTWCLPTVAMILANKFEPEKAVKVLALAFHHPSSLSGWLENWPMMTRLRSELTEAVGPKHYYAQWESGHELDLHAVVVDWLSSNG